MYQFRSVNRGSTALAAVPAFMLGQTVTDQDIVNELTDRGFNRGTAPVTPTPAVTPAATPPTTVPAITREEAIRAAVDKSLQLAGYSTTCSTPGGCWISATQYDTIVYYSKYYANRYLTQGTISGISGITIQPVGGFGQVNNQVASTAQTTGMTFWEKLALGLGIVGGFLTTGSQYITSREERKRLEALQTQMSTLSELQLDKIIKAYQAAAGGGLPAQVAAVGEEAKGIVKAEMPGWLMPAIVGLAAIVLIPMVGRR